MNISALDPDQRAVRSALSWVTVGVSAAAILSNGLVLALFATHRPLWTVANALVASLAAADLVFGASLLLSKVYREVFPQSTALCGLVYVFIPWSSIASPWSLLALTVDRYIYIRLPLAYARRVGRRAVSVTVAAIWGASLGFALLGLVPWPDGPGTRRLCGGNVTRTVPYLLAFFGLVILPCAFVGVLYCSILQAARRSNRLHQELIRLVPTVQPTAENKLTPETAVRKDANRAARLPAEAPNAPSSPRKVRRITQTTKMFLYLTLIFFVLWLPMDVLIWMQLFCEECQQDRKFQVGLWVSITLYTCTPLINPWLYTLRNRDFRLALNRVGPCRQWRPKDPGSILNSVDSLLS